MTGDPLRIVVTGFIAQYALGGLTWDYVNHLVGLRRLGHDVHYVEDTGAWPYSPAEGGVSGRGEVNLAHLADTMARFDLADRWACRFAPTGDWHGLDDARRREVAATADLVLNVSGSLHDPEAVSGAARLAFVDTDPAFTQVRLCGDDDDLRRLVEAHDVRFTYGELLPGSALDTGHGWQPTRQPVVLDEWRTSRPPGERLTTVMNWTSYEPVEHAGVRYGQKDVEFVRFLDLPSRVPGARLELAVNDGKTDRTPRADLARHGWVLRDPRAVSGEVDDYRDYLHGSLGEWSVAKGGYVASRCGWFSDRSACYLASGRPVVLQDTGWSQVLPSGAGLLAFDDLDGAVGAVEAVMSDPAGHARAAAEVAAEYFDSDRVLTDLLERAGAG